MLVVTITDGGWGVFIPIAPNFCSCEEKTARYTRSQQRGYFFLTLVEELTSIRFGSEPPLRRDQRSLIEGQRRPLSLYVS